MNQLTTSILKRTIKVQPKVPYYYKVYNSKLVNMRTRKNYKNEKIRLQDSVTKWISKDVHENTREDDAMKYLKQHVYSTGDEEGLSDDKEDFLPSDDLDDNKQDLEDFELLLNDDKLFTAPGFININNSDQNNNININDLWILLWIFKYQERFRLSDVAINSLISFFSLVLKNINSNQFKGFLSRKILDIKKTRSPSLLTLIATNFIT
ncbi:13866_t:CDS:2 [Funneliformis caledonium]|uniref:13866_t:CDS:1 n=1 Tax=Funneliformis caledonium TaxID=1117310 RepID=A0A9N9DTQ2_9GLOM|nr:13866_t:CDS:2 [Funneliformis caledonium]